MYLINVSELVPMGREIVGIKDLKEGHFFQGPHELILDPLLNRYGEDIASFEAAATALGGVAVDMADAAYQLKPYPRIPLYYLLWAEDDEFPASVSILFDRSIEDHLQADAIWGLVNLVSDRIIMA
jgi:hypothetical protein